jgi:hypothetical protein
VGCTWEEIHWVSEPLEALLLSFNTQTLNFTQYFPGIKYQGKTIESMIYRPDLLLSKHRLRAVLIRVTKDHGWHSTMTSEEIGLIVGKCKMQRLIQVSPLLD